MTISDVVRKVVTASAMLSVDAILLVVNGFKVVCPGIVDADLI